MSTVPEKRDPAAARVAAWRLVTSGVEAGLPVPLTTYVASAGDTVTLDLSDPADVSVWAVHLDLGAPMVDVYSKPDGEVRRLTLARNTGPLWISVRCGERVLEATS